MEEKVSDLSLKVTKMSGQKHWLLLLIQSSVSSTFSHAASHLIVQRKNLTSLLWILFLVFFPPRATFYLFCGGGGQITLLHWPVSATPFLSAVSSFCLPSTSHLSPTGLKPTCTGIRVCFFHLLTLASAQAAVDAQRLKFQNFFVKNDWYRCHTSGSW